MLELSHNEIVHRPSNRLVVGQIIAGLILIFSVPYRVSIFYYHKLPEPTVSTIFIISFIFVFRVMSIRTESEWEFALFPAIPSTIITLVISSLSIYFFYLMKSSKNFRPLLLVSITTFVTMVFPLLLPLLLTLIYGSALPFNILDILVLTYPYLFLIQLFFVFIPLILRIFHISYRMGAHPSKFGFIKRIRQLFSIDRVYVLSLILSPILLLTDDLSSRVLIFNGLCFSILTFDSAYIKSYEISVGISSFQYLFFMILPLLFLTWMSNRYYVHQQTSRNRLLVVLVVTIVFFFSLNILFGLTSPNNTLYVILPLSIVPLIYWTMRDSHRLYMVPTIAPQPRITTTTTPAQVMVRVQLHYRILSILRRWLSRARSRNAITDNEDKL